MGVETADVREGLVADVALERLVLRVRSNVLGQVAGENEGLLALRALEQARLGRDGVVHRGQHFAAPPSARSLRFHGKKVRFPCEMRPFESTYVMLRVDWLCCFRPWPALADGSQVAAAASAGASDSPPRRSGRPGAEVARRSANHFWHFRPRRRRRGAARRSAPAAATSRGTRRR